MTRPPDGLGAGFSCVGNLHLQVINAPAPGPVPRHGGPVPRLGNAFEDPEEQGHGSQKPEQRADQRPHDLPDHGPNVGLGLRGGIHHDVDDQGDRQDHRRQPLQRAHVDGIQFRPDQVVRSVAIPGGQPTRVSEFLEGVPLCGSLAGTGAEPFLLHVRGQGGQLTGDVFALSFGQMRDDLVDVATGQSGHRGDSFQRVAILAVSRVHSSRSSSATPAPSSVRL